MRIGDIVQTAQVGDGSLHLPQNDTDQHFGIGDSEFVDELTINWPEGIQETHHEVSPDPTLTYTPTPEDAAVPPAE